MASNQHGALGLANERSGSSKKGRKNGSNKPKQPQRGLGVAQLEMIRLHNQIMSDTCIPSLHSSSNKSLMKIDLEDHETRTRYSEFQSSTTISSVPIQNSILAPQISTELPVTLPLFDSIMEHLEPKRCLHDQRYSANSIGQNSYSSDPQEIDLELRLSL